MPQLELSPAEIRLINERKRKVAEVKTEAARNGKVDVTLDELDKVLDPVPCHREELRQERAKYTPKAKATNVDELPLVLAEYYAWVTKRYAAGLPFDAEACAADLKRTASAAKNARQKLIMRGLWPWTTRKMKPYKNARKPAPVDPTPVPEPAPVPEDTTGSKIEASIPELAVSALDLNFEGPSPIRVLTKLTRELKRLPVIDRLEVIECLREMMF